MKISEQIFCEIRDGKVKYNVLNNKERQEIFKLVCRYYVDLNLKGEYIWEKFKQYATFQGGESWHIIRHYVKNNKCIIFFNQDEDVQMLKFFSGKDLDFMLSETPGFEFYVTDRKASYLICFNHHDILYGCGTAKTWVEKLSK